MADSVLNFIKLDLGFVGLAAVAGLSAKRGSRRQSLGNWRTDRSPGEGGREGGLPDGCSFQTRSIGIGCENFKGSQGKL